MHILTLDNGKRVSITPDEITREDALEIARKLFAAYGIQGPRIPRKIMYEVEYEVEPTVKSLLTHDQWLC